MVKFAIKITFWSIYFTFSSLAIPIIFAILVLVQFFFFSVLEFVRKVKKSLNYNDRERKLFHHNPMIKIANSNVNEFHSTIKI